MCDEYDDVRSEAFWRGIAEHEGLASLEIPGSQSAQPSLRPIGAEPAPKPKSLAR
jgi:hypothetical protein